MALFPKKSKADASDDPAEISSKNRKTLQLDIGKIKEEIEENRKKKAVEDSIPETHMAPEDMVLFKNIDELAAKSDAKKEPEEDATVVQNSDGNSSDQNTTVGKDVGTPNDDNASKLEKLDTSSTGAGELEHVEKGDLVSVAPKVTRWQKFLGAGRQRQIMIGLGAIAAAIVVGTALWFTRGWRGWTGNLIVFSIPVLVILTYVLEYFSQDRFWEDYRHVKFLRKENRADAVVLIPLVLFMGLVSLYSYMSFGQAFVHYARFVAIATIVWMGLIWLTRRVPPYRKKGE